MAAKATLTRIDKERWNVTVVTTDRRGKVTARNGSTLVGSEQDARKFAREVGGRNVKISKS